MFTVVTGGSASGKSAYAEGLVTDLKKKESIEDAHTFYVATMYPFDAESHRRIERHRKMRAGKGFTTIEQPLHLCDIAIEPDGLVLMECMSNLAANEMYMEEGAGDAAVAAIMDGIVKLEETCRHLIVVTNEVFSDGNSYDESTEKYLQYLGRINQEMGQRADQVVEVVYGIPIIKKETGITADAVTGQVEISEENLE